MRDEHKTKLKQAKTTVQSARGLLSEVLADLGAELKDLPSDSERREDIIALIDNIKEVDGTLECAFDDYIDLED